MEKSHGVSGGGPHAKDAPESQYMPLGVRIRQEWLMRKKAELSIISDKIGEALDKIQTGVNTAGTLRIRSRPKSRNKNFNQIKTGGMASTATVSTDSRDGSNRVPGQVSDFPQTSSCHVLIASKKSCEPVKPYNNYRSRDRISANDDCLANGKIYLPKSKETKRLSNFKIKSFASTTKAETRSRSRNRDWRSAAKRRTSNGTKRSSSKRKEHRHLPDAFMETLPHPIGSQAQKKKVKSNYVEICCEREKGLETDSITKVKDKHHMAKKVKKSFLKNQDPVSLKQSEQRHNNDKTTNNQILFIAAAKRKRKLTPAKNETKILPKINKPVEKRNARAQPKSETHTRNTSLVKTTASSDETKTENKPEDSKSAHKNIDTQTQSLLENELDGMFDSKEFQAVMEATRVGTTVLKAGSKRHRHRKASRSRNRQRMKRTTNASSRESQNSSVAEKASDISSSFFKRTGDIITSASTDTIHKDGNDDGGIVGGSNYDDDDTTENGVDSFLCHSLSERLQDKLSCIKAKGSLHLSEVGFRNHQAYPVNSVYRHSHNSLPRTPQQLGVACMKIKPSFHTRMLESLYSDLEGKHRSKEKTGKKGERKRKKKKRTASCMPRVGVSEQKSVRKGKKKRNHEKLER